jgi:hypothetical protein
MIDQLLDFTRSRLSLATWNEGGRYGRARAQPETAQFKPLPREDRAAPALDTQIHVEYGADRERLLASSRASGILPTTFRIAVLPVGSAAGSLPSRRPIWECSIGTRG